MYKGSADIIRGHLVCLFILRQVKTLACLRCADLALCNVVLCNSVEHIPHDVLLGKIDLIIDLARRHAHIIGVKISDLGRPRQRERPAIAPLLAFYGSDIVFSVGVPQIEFGRKIIYIYFFILRDRAGICTS